MISFHKYCSIRVWINKFLHRQSCLAVLSNFWLAYKSVWCVSNSLISFCAKTFSQSFNWYIMMSCKYSFEKTRIFLRFIVWWINFSTFYILEISTNIISIREINLKMSLDLEIDWNIYFFQSHQKNHSCCFHRNECKLLSHMTHFLRDFPFLLWVKILSRNVNYDFLVVIAPLWRQENSEFIDETLCNR